MKKNKRGILGILIIVVGLGFIFYQPIVNNFIAPKNLEDNYKNNLTAEDIKGNLDRLKGLDVDEEELFDYESVDTLRTMDISPKINKDNVVGGIYVPSVNMVMPIMYGVNNDILRSSAGTMRPDQVMGKGNYVLLGHNSRNPNVLFAPIRRINMDDKIYVTDKEKLYVYEMYNSEVVMPDKVEVMNDTEEDIVTLISCYSDDGSDRIIVKGELVETLDFEDASEDVLNKLGQI